MALATEQFEALKHLEENWDGYGAAPPDPRTVDVANALARLIDAAKAMTGANLQASPTRIGGVLLEWEDPVAEHEIEVLPDGSFGFLARNKATGEIHTKQISSFPLRLDFLNALQELIAA